MQRALQFSPFWKPRTFLSSLARVSAPRPLLPSPSRAFARLRSTGSRGAAARMSRADVDSASASKAPIVQKSKICYCESCGGPTKQVVPNGEDKLRAVCTLCEKIHYENPKMVVGCLVEHSNKVLLCKRNIEPSYGLCSTVVAPFIPELMQHVRTAEPLRKRTLPAGYLEIGESAVEGATRETLEEASADVEVLSPFAQIDIPHIGQCYLIFRAKLKKPQFSPGPESLECALFGLDEIPFDSLAFSSIFVTLKLYIEDIKAGKLKFHYCTINKRPGASPSDPHGFSVDYQLHC